jgi:hypothetical protein
VVTDAIKFRIAIRAWHRISIQYKGCKGIDGTLRSMFGVYAYWQPATKKLKKINASGP